MHISKQAFDVFDEMHGEFNRSGECTVRATLSLSRGLKAILASRRKKDPKWFSVEFSEVCLEPEDWEHTEQGGVVKYVLTLRKKLGKPTGPEAGKARAEGRLNDVPMSIGSRRKDIEEACARMENETIWDMHKPGRTIVWKNADGYEQLYSTWWAANESVDAMFAKGWIQRREYKANTFDWGPPEETWGPGLVEQANEAWKMEEEVVGKAPVADGWLGRFVAKARVEGWI